MPDWARTIARHVLYETADALRIAGALWRFFSMRRVFEGRRWTYAQWNRIVNKAAHAFRAAGFSNLLVKRIALHRCASRLANRLHGLGVMAALDQKIHIVRRVVLGTMRTRVTAFSNSTVMIAGLSGAFSGSSVRE